VALDQSALLEVLDALMVAEVDDRIRQAAQTIYQALIEAELTSVIGAAPHERTPERLAQRNGHRPRVLTTSAGDLELRIPKLRAGSFFPSLLERRRRVDQALFAVVMEAYLHGVSTRKVDDLVRALGADSGISKSQVSRICADLDGEVSALRDRSLAGQVFPYVFVDATYCKARVNRRVVAQAVVVATGVCGDGRREVLGFGVGDSEDGAFWTAFLRSPNPMPLMSTTSSTSSPGCWAASSPSSSACSATAPRSCWPSPRSRSATGSSGPPTLLERLNKEIKRRTDVVGVFSNSEALGRLAGAVLVEAHHEWQVSDRRYLSEGSMALLTQAPKELAPAQLMPA
jgi:transposase-like protein